MSDRDAGAAPPGLPEVHVHADAAALADGAAAWIARALADAIAARGMASLALAGGSTPRALHARLAARPIDWRAIAIWFGDERCVPPDDAASNYRMARESLLDALPIPPAAVHRIEGELAPAEAARRYQAQLAAAPPLDVVVLGMGDDGHVASWFPGTPPFDPEALAATTDSPKPPPARVTMTPRTLAAAREVVLLVSGEAKAARLAEIHAQLRAGQPTLPAARVHGAGGPPRWFVDDAAARALPPSVREKGQEQ
ncbi:MAG TPA: 6-phosphogluconolactonase [Kofleriaceae bacterium]|nr:6-phosphogluconolactonase [Kofleriaceae bacterium]